MKCIVIAALLLSTSAHAEDAPSVTAPPPTVASTASQPVVVLPSVWMMGDLDKRDLSDINSAMNKCPKEVADPLIALFNSKIKVQK